MRRISLFFMAMAFLFSCNPLKQDLAVVKINGTEILTQSALQKKMAQSAWLYDYNQLKSPSIFYSAKEKVIEEWITTTIAYREAKQRGIRVTEEELKRSLLSYKGGYTENAFNEMLRKQGLTFEQWAHEKEKKLYADRLIEKEILPTIEISKKEIADYYDQHRSEFIEPAKIHARHIVVSSAELANTIYRQLQEGANFASLAKRYSTAPESSEGGDLGYFHEGEFPPIFDQICLHLPIGMISQPIKSDYGYHIFKVLHRTAKQAMVKKEAFNLIEERLKQERLADEVKVFLEELKKTYQIMIHYDLLNTIEVPREKIE